MTSFLYNIIYIRTDYAYDAVHNRTSATRRYIYASDSNRLTAIGRQGVSYDARGNLTSDRSGRRSLEAVSAVVFLVEGLVYYSGNVDLPNTGKRCPIVTP
ncbi:hypothetical protein [uncultured Algimonas sp.]|uniref:hypothetical protein n=1 Tax=uncultured Algimonas sp. TaxID=1547920 RepID=UPI00261EBB0F|nr:hypothetical protein [uncultured Algimonas sp.]